MDLINTVLPVVTKDLPISPRFTPYIFLSRCKFSTLTTRQPMIEFYLLAFSRFPLRKKEHKSYFGKNRTHDFRTSRCAGYLLDHSGDEGLREIGLVTTRVIYITSWNTAWCPANALNKAPNTLTSPNHVTKCIASWWNVGVCSVTLTCVPRTTWRLVPL